MSVRVVRTRSGEDIICDLYEVTTKDENPSTVGLQLNDPYVVYLTDSITVDAGDNDEGAIHTIANPTVAMEPWIPLSERKQVLVRSDEVIAVYETYPDVIEKYNQLLEANGRTNDQIDPPEGSNRVPVGTSDTAG